MQANYEIFKIELYNKYKVMNICVSEEHKVLKRCGGENIE